MQMRKSFFHQTNDTDAEINFHLMHITEHEFNADHYWSLLQSMLNWYFNRHISYAKIFFNTLKKYNRCPEYFSAHS